MRSSSPGLWSSIGLFVALTIARGAAAEAPTIDALRTELVRVEAAQHGAMDRRRVAVRDLLMTCPPGLDIGDLRGRDGPAQQSLDDREGLAHDPWYQGLARTVGLLVRAQPAAHEQRQRHQRHRHQASQKRPVATARAVLVWLLRPAVVTGRLLGLLEQSRPLYARLWERRLRGAVA